VTPLSTRYASGLLALAFVFAAFIGADAALERRVDECRDPEALIAPGLLPPEAEPLPGHKPKHVSTFVWDRRIHGIRKDLTFDYVVARSFAPSDFFASSSAFLPQREALFALPPVPDVLVVDGERLPFQVTHFTSVEYGIFVGTLLIDGGRATSDVLASRLSEPLSGLLRGQRPITAFVLSVTARRGEAIGYEPEVRAWLAEAWRRYRDACGAS
jgi:hypothetical protein